MSKKTVIIPTLLLSATVLGEQRLGDPYEAYEAGEYDRALQGFVDLQVEHPEDPRMDLHLGSAHYRMKNYAEAEKAFAQAALATVARVRQQAFYNLGNTAYRQGKLEDAVEWYKRALEVDPQDQDAKFNLEFVRDEIRRRHEEAKKQQQQQKQKQCDQRQQEQQGEQERRGEQERQGEQEQQGEQGQQQGGPETQQAEEARQAQRGEDGQRAEEEPQEQQMGAARPMTPEEAKRYLQGLSEDRKKHLEKRRGKWGRRRRPAKDW